jgi:hypothetical protein
VPARESKEKGQLPVYQSHRILRELQETLGEGKLRTAREDVAEFFRALSAARMCCKFEALNILRRKCFGPLPRYSMVCAFQCDHRAKES